MLPSSFLKDARRQVVARAVIALLALAGTAFASSAQADHFKPTAKNNINKQIYDGRRDNDRGGGGRDRDHDRDHGSRSRVSINFGIGTGYYGGYSSYRRYDDCRPRVYCPPPVVVRPYCPPTVVVRDCDDYRYRYSPRPTVVVQEPVVVERPVYVERRVEVERPVVIEQPQQPVYVQQPVVQSQPVVQQVTYQTAAVTAEAGTYRDRELGDAYLRMGDHGNAVRVYKRYLAAWDKDGTATRNLGFAQIASGEAQDGFRNVAQGYRLEPDLAKRQLRPADLGGEVGYTRLLDAASRSADGVNTADAWLTVAILQHVGGKSDAAVTALQKSRDAGLGTDLLDQFTLQFSTPKN